LRREENKKRANERRGKWKTEIRKLKKIENTQTKKCGKMEDKNFTGKYEKRRKHVMG
jgi:hypothetical protein